MTTFYCLRFETQPTWRARSTYLYFTGTGWSSYTPRHWVLFSSPSMTMDIFDPASTRGFWQFRSLVYYNVTVRPVRQYGVTMATNCRLLTHCINVSHAVGLERKGSLPVQCIVSTLWVRILFWCGNVKFCIRVLSRVRVALDGVLDCTLNLLSTYRSQLQISIILSLISTLYKLLQHKLRLFSLSCIH
jgi:hypothetical protein